MEAQTHSKRRGGVLIALNVHLIGCNVLAEEQSNLGEHELEQHQETAEQNNEDRDVQADERNAYESVAFAVRHITLCAGQLAS